MLEIITTEGDPFPHNLMCNNVLIAEFTNVEDCVIIKNSLINGNAIKLVVHAWVELEPDKQTIFTDGIGMWLQRGHIGKICFAVQIGCELFAMQLNKIKGKVYIYEGVHEFKRPKISVDSGDVRNDSIESVE